MIWHQTSVDNALAATGSTPQGLRDEAVMEKRATYGLNTLEEKKKKPAWVIFLSQFKDFMIIVLFVAALIAGYAGDLTDTIIIFVIIILNALIGFIQEFKAEKAMDALRKMSAVYASVQRNGATVLIPSAELVPGDIVHIEAGNVVPADMRLIDAHNLHINESALTGESLPVHKVIDVLEKEDLPIGDRFNMAYKSSLVVNGRALGLVIATGMNTEIGNIAKMLQEEELDTPLKKRMAQFGKKLSYIIFGICGALFGIGLLNGEQPMEMLMISISLAVAAIPEALPALITVALSMGAKRLMQKKALIRKLPAVETLGSISFICSDKTGTLTLNKMTVTEYLEIQGSDIRKAISPFLAGIALNHDVRLTAEGALIGDPTEIALVEKAKALEEGIIERLAKELPRVIELPFDSDRKCMTTVHEYDNKFLVLSKGAIESITAILQQPAEDLEKQAALWASKGMRVIAYGYKFIDQLPKQIHYDSLEKDLLPAGIAAMIDPPREEAKLAIQDCRTAGIIPVMITGDHPETARFIAEEIGILTPGRISVTGTELAAMSDDLFKTKVNDISVYARVSPEQKLRIVRALQANGHFMAMTGDGVNDAPSLKAADIGVAMGINGTDVSKESADMILLDDNFATIVNAVKEGRRIYDNIRKFVKYIMTCNGAEIWTIFLAPLMGLPMPLLPIHILWINLVTDGLPGLALANEKEEKDIMKRPPRPSEESLFAGGIAIHIIWVGLLMAGLTLGTQAWAYHSGREHWQTMVFTVLSFAQLAHVLAIRSEKEFLYRQGIFSNLPLAGAVFLTVLLQMAVIYLPFANKIFKTQPLSVAEFLICLGVAAVLFHAVELEKLIRYRKK